MGRRKIEIKAIKDDRNRSVRCDEDIPTPHRRAILDSPWLHWHSFANLSLFSTFLKRKGGLFKKAHELSVLCSVDVAVIIFGHNKKLYEYSSGDINETIGRFQYVCLALLSSPPALSLPTEWQARRVCKRSRQLRYLLVQEATALRPNPAPPSSLPSPFIPLVYGSAHEHKGPADFAGRGNLDDDDDDDMGSPPPDDQVQHDSIPRDHPYPSHLQSQPPHMRQPAQSASPPIQNGVPFYQRNHTPQPQMISRPQSRNMVHPSNFPNRPPEFASNTASHQHHQVTQGPQGPNGYAYHHNPSAYTSHQMQGQQQPYYTQHPQPQHAQMQQAYMQDQRRQSMPPAFPQHERSQQPPQTQQQHQQRQQQQPSQPQPPQHPQPMASPPQPKQEPQQENEPGRLAKPLPAKSRSIFTPIDDSRSLLAQHWGLGKSSDSREIKAEKENRSQSVDVAAMHARNTKPPPSEDNITSPLRKASTMPQRNSLPNEIPPPPRTNSAQIAPAKRPRLKVQIPSEQSDGGSATPDDESSPRGESGGTASETPNAKASTDASHSSGVVLPPPSPSASAILSAGAQGPPNPFARPHPPSHNPNGGGGGGGSFSSSGNNNNSGNNSRDIETPISALPSRFVGGDLLPSPSSFYPNWDFGRSGDGGNMLPSPLTFQTPVVGQGPSFLREEEERERKRKSPEGETQEAGPGQLKRVKT
ncbi:MAG: hypothetical protein L6R40_008140 [Gallowayella cf. fulva]|nr:MAG: hypothetical protein L6R40_008140 [Xanthomendoza cf. fulva]